MFFYSKCLECLLRFCCIDRVIVDKTNKGNDFSANAYFLSCNAIVLPNTASLQPSVSDWLCEQLVNTLLREIL
jgi:hypothetical protein